MKERTTLMIDKQRLEAKCSTWNITLTGTQLDQLDAFAEILVDYNQKVNLTAITDPEGIEDKHFLDSLLFASQPEVAGRMVDVGAGAGFPGIVTKIYKPELELTGLVINPFSDNLVLKTELVRKLHEADQKAAQMRQVKMTPQQFNVFVKKQVEFGVLPKRLYAEGETFVRKLCEEREAFVNQIFAETYKEPKLYPYTEADYSVMALDIAEDLTLIRVDLPEKALAAPLCYRIYITFNPQTKKAGYYTIEMTAEKEVRALGQILPDGRHESLGEAPVEGAELQKIMDLARYDGTEMTS